MIFLMIPTAASNPATMPAKSSFLSIRTPSFWASHAPQPTLERIYYIPDVMRAWMPRPHRTSSFAACYLYWHICLRQEWIKASTNWGTGSGVHRIKWSGFHIYEAKRDRCTLCRLVRPFRGRDAESADAHVRLRVWHCSLGESPVLRNVALDRIRGLGPSALWIRQRKRGGGWLHERDTGSRSCNCGVHMGTRHPGQKYAQ